MIRILWEYTVHPGREAEFVHRYGPDGDWARLFRRDPAFREVVLLRDRDDPRRFATIDAWQDLESFRAFRQRFAEEYGVLDEACESLTEVERRLGVFVDVS